jgi:hypothetical protein
MCDWRRGIGRREVGDSEEVAGAGGEDAETIAAYFDLHGLSSSTGLIAGKMNHVRTFVDRTLFTSIERKKKVDRDGKDEGARPPPLLLFLFWCCPSFLV